MRVATYNIENGVGAIGSEEYNAVQAILARMDADIVCFQELQTTSFAAWSNMAATLGYPYNAIGWDGGSMAGSLYMGYFSRFPILSTYNVESPPGAKEMSRYPFRAVIDVPDAHNPLVIWNMHHKSGAASIDKFRRAIEAYRIVQDIDSYLVEHFDNEEYILVGDMNDDIRDSQTAQFGSQPSGAPAGYVLGTDITFPVAYATFPVDRYVNAGFSLIRIPAFWESTDIPTTRIASGRELDYIFLSPALCTNSLGAPQSEVYYSAMDLGAGLPKWGDPLPPSASATASDHLPIFVDIQMTDASSVEPVADFTTSGEAGGPFSPVSVFYTVSETNPVGSTWSVSADVDWVTILPDHFTVTSNGVQEVEVFLNSLAESLMPGAYTATVTFRNETGDITKVRQVDLTVRDPLGASPSTGLDSTGYSGGPFSPDSKSYMVTNNSLQPVSFTATASATWLTVSPESWLLQPRSSCSVTVALNSLANSQSIGTHLASVVFSNQSSGLVQARPGVLTVVGKLCDAVDRCDLEWTTGGDAAWFYQAEATEDGTDAAQSGSLSSGQQTWLETVVQGPVQVAYWWRVSSQTNTHLLRYLDNGVAQDQISGETEWVRRTHEVTTGVHTLRWAFATASTTPQGTNAAWLDQVLIDHLSVSPADEWVASGWSGGPFTPGSRDYTITNSGSTAISWSAAAGTNWITVSPPNGTLEPGTSATVGCSLNANANTLPLGTYSGSIVFSNLETGLTIQRSVLLAARGPLCDAVERCDLVWTTGGSSDWFSQTNKTVDGVDSAQTGPITTNQENWLETKVTGPVQFSFQWLVSSRSSHYLRFHIDSGLQLAISGSPGWARRSFAIGTGSHTLRWTFSNDSTAPQGTNAGWIDQVTLDYLTATPTNAWTPQGRVGGPFTPATQEYVLTNSGPSALQWTANAASNWIACTPDGGHLEPGGFAIVECSPNSLALALAPGTYSTSIIFSNQTTGSSIGRPASLTVLDYLVISPTLSSNTGFVGGPYSPGSTVFSISNSGSSVANWAATTTNNWLTLSSSTGTIDPGATSNIVASISANADSLSAGLRSTRISFSNKTTRITQVRPVYLNLGDALAVNVIGGSPSGPAGGPFSPETSFIVTNRSRVTQNWVALTSTNWLTLGTTNGTLDPYAGTSVAATVNSNATTFPTGVYPATVVFSNLTSRTAITLSPYLSVGHAFCDAVEACGIDWSFGGNAPWLYQTNVTKDGVDAAACGSITNNQESWMQASFTGPGTVTFWWKVSSVAGRDFFDISVNGAHQLFSGTSQWQQQTNIFGSGPQTIRWRFYKNSSGSNVLSGGAYVDLVSWTPNNTTMGVPVEWYQRFGLAPGSGGTWDDLDPLPSAADAPNWFQYVAGLNPTNPADRFEILTFQQAAGQPARIEWWGGTNGPSAPYVIQTTTNLDQGPWSPTGSSARVQGINIWTNAEPADIKRYYRVVAPW